MEFTSQELIVLKDLLSDKMVECADNREKWNKYNKIYSKLWRYLYKNGLI